MQGVAMKKRLYKSSKDKKICGVCAGLADYFELDPTVVRILWLIMLFVFGTGVLAYIICAIIMPYDTEIMTDEEADYEYAPKD